MRCPLKAVRTVDFFRRHSFGFPSDNGILSPFPPSSSRWPYFLNQSVGIHDLSQREIREIGREVCVLYALYLSSDKNMLSLATTRFFWSPKHGNWINICFKKCKIVFEKASKSFPYNFSLFRIVHTINNTEYTNKYTYPLYQRYNLFLFLRKTKVLIQQHVFY